MNLIELVTHWNYSDILIICAIIFFIYVLGVWHVDDTKFDLRCIIIEDRTGKVSLHKLGQVSALFVSSIIIWYETVNGRLTDWLFTGYMISWAGTSLAKRWIDKSTTPPTI